MNRYVVDTQSIRHNCALIRDLTGGSPVYAVVKGNAYGLGLSKAASILNEEGFQKFAVTEPCEAVELLREVPSAEVLILHPVTDKSDLHELVRLPVTFSIGSDESAAALNDAARECGVKASAHIQIDTGMCRYGFNSDDISGILAVYQKDNIDITGIYTHYHSACMSRSQTKKQYGEFMETVAQIRNAGYDAGFIHTANSSAVFRYKEDFTQGARIGSAFWGRLGFKSNIGLKRVGYVEATVDEVRTLYRGQTIGYGAAFRANKDMEVAILPVGYYHGFGVIHDCGKYRPRDFPMRLASLIKRTVTQRSPYVEVGGRRVKALGNIGMNHTVVDVTGISCHAGDLVKLDVSPVDIKGLPVVYC